RDRPFRALEHPCEAALLDLRQQLFLAAYVVVHPGEGHPARGGEVAHGGRVVAFVGEHPGGLGEEVIEAFVVGAHGFSNGCSNRNLRWAAPGGKGSKGGTLPQANAALLPPLPPLPPY